MGSSRGAPSVDRNESGTREKIMNVLLLGEVNAIRHGRDLEIKEVTKRIQIKYQEFVTKMLLHKVNELIIITSNDHIIDIEKKRATTRGSVDKESRLVVIGLKNSINDSSGEALKPGLRSLLEAVERATQPANHSIRDRVSRRWLHVYLLTQLAIEKGFLDIKLGDGPLSDRSNREKSPDCGHMSNGSKGLIIITTLLLLKTTRYKMSLVVLKGAIRASFDLVDPLASNRSQLRRQRYKVPCTGALQGSNLLSHGALPIWVDSSLTISGWLNKHSSNEAIAIRRMESTTITKSIPRGWLWRKSKERRRRLR